ncbi:hypothetical protein ACQP1G_21505 [Nocardia sp. CA-107356]|uniref:hypothetical protein n=1 Tax=Nocardia sp. CA-107356 TaxID=3239972 RepID=UPI003D944DA4
MIGIHAHRRDDPASGIGQRLVPRRRAARLMAFKVYTNDTQDGRVLEFGDDAMFGFQGDVLMVESSSPA